MFNWPSGILQNIHKKPEATSLHQHNLHLLFLTALSCHAFAHTGTPVHTRKTTGQNRGFRDQSFRAVASVIGDIKNGRIHFTALCSIVKSDTFNHYSNIYNIKLCTDTRAFALSTAEELKFHPFTKFNINTSVSYPIRVS